jgi:hypothetical protein
MTVGLLLSNSEGSKLDFALQLSPRGLVDDLPLQPCRRLELSIGSLSQRICAA